MGMSKRYKNLIEEAPTGQTWNNLIKKKRIMTIIDYKTLN